MKECTWEEEEEEEEEEGGFHVSTTFTIHFTLSLIFINVWLVEDLLFEINLNIYIYI